MSKAIVKDGKFYAAYGKFGVAYYLREQGIIVALGDDWADIDFGVEIPTLPMELPASSQHNTPVIEDGIVKWRLPE